MQTKTKIDPKSIYICVDAYTVDIDGIPEVFQQGMRLRGNHPTVSDHPELWALEADPDEFNRKRRELYAEVHAQRPGDATSIRILNTKFRARKNVRVDVDGEPRRVRKGDLVEVTDPIALIAPGSFERVQVPM